MSAPLPVLVYDGGCGLCRASVERLRRWGLLEAVEARPFASFEGDTARRLLEAGIERALVVLDGEGRSHTGIDGLAELLALGGRKRTARWMRMPPFRFLLGIGYAAVAHHRRLLSGLLSRRP